MARVIQENIKKPLADEVLFGKLKDGGHVKVVVLKNEVGRDALGFEYLDGPITPKPEKLPAIGAKPKRKSPQRKPKPPSNKGGDGGNSGGPDSSGRGSVPKVPLVKA